MIDYINTLPECPRCIGGRMLSDDRVPNKSCLNCGYRPPEDLTREAKLAIKLMGNNPRTFFIEPQQQQMSFHTAKFKKKHPKRYKILRK